MHLVLVPDHFGRVAHSVGEIEAITTLERDADEIGLEQNHLARRPVEDDDAAIRSASVGALQVLDRFVEIRTEEEYFDHEPVLLDVQKDELHGRVFGGDESGALFRMGTALRRHVHASGAVFSRRAHVGPDN